MIKKKRTNEEIVVWAHKYLECGENLCTLERNLCVPHATACWCFHNRLFYIDYYLYTQVMEKIDINKHIKVRTIKKED